MKEVNKEDSKYTIVLDTDNWYIIYRTDTGRLVDVAWTWWGAKFKAWRDSEKKLSLREKEYFYIG